MNFWFNAPSWEHVGSIEFCRDKFITHNFEIYRNCADGQVVAMYHDYPHEPTMLADLRVMALQYDTLQRRKFNALLAGLGLNRE